MHRHSKVNNAKTNDALKVSILVPTRDRGKYLEHCLKGLLSCSSRNLEIIVLDNASTDSTETVVGQFNDHRLVYKRSPIRLSMRQNFERGIDYTTGDVMCYIGDDDCVLPHAPEFVRKTFEKEKVDAVMAPRAHYWWPDYLGSRSNMALLPRRKETTIGKSRKALRSILKDDDYYKVPCIYHGFIRKSVVEAIRERQGEFFLSSQVDIYSSIALSMENISYIYTDAPLIVNGGSGRSNGASHFCKQLSIEKKLFQKEDDCGLLIGFSPALTVATLILESSVRYCQANPQIQPLDLFEADDLDHAIAKELTARKHAGLCPTLNAGLLESFKRKAASPLMLVRKSSKRIFGPLGSFLAYQPIDMGCLDINNVADAAIYLNGRILLGKRAVWSSGIKQISAAFKMARRRDSID